VVGDGALLEIGGEIWSSPAVGDIDGDGNLEIAVGARFLGNDNFYVMDGRGIPRPGWPKSLEWGVLTSPVLSDIDGDGKLEIFVISESGKLYAFRYDGSAVFNDSCVLKQLYGGSLGTPAIGDINTDGFLEIVCGGGSRSDSLFVWDHLGHYLPPFPVSVAAQMKYSPVLGDIGGDNHLEICIYTDSTQLLNVVNSNGAVLWQQNFNLGDVEASPILADLAGSARPEIVCGNDLGLAVYDSLGNLLPGFPLYGMEHDWKLPICADLDADSANDIACGSSAWALFAHKSDGSVVTGFPIPMGNRVECSPAVADLNRDGKLELLSGDAGFHFYVFNLNSEVFDWPKFRYDQYNTGCYHSGNWHGIRVNYTYHGNPAFFLYANPNPFRDRINIRFGLGVKAEESGIEDKGLGMRIYDISGRLVKSFALSSATSLSGPYAQSLLWDGSDDHGRTVAAGIYFIRLEAAEKSMIRKIIRIR
jgi:outer membrane protein assembly factor BamB